MTRRGWRARMLCCALAALALAIGLMGAGGAPAARASGRGPCTPLTASDLAQPQVTPRGHASAWLSRSEGTDGTLLSITGSGWPANTAVAVDGWSDNENDLLADGVAIQAKTTASGELRTPPFRIDTGCEELGFLNTPVKSVSVILVAHTLDDIYHFGSVRARMIFNWQPSPLFNGARPGFGWQEAALATLHAGDTLSISSAGWAPGDLVTITTLVAPWPTFPASPYGALPVATPTSPGDISTTTDSSGRFSLTYHVPDAAPLSRLLLLLYTRDPRFGDVSMYLTGPFMLLPTVYPTTLLAERTALAGGALTVTGDHWLPDHLIDIKYCRGQARDRTDSLYCGPYASETLGTARTDSSGHFFAQVRLPTNARLGDITVQARLDGSWLWQVPDSRPFAAAQPLTIVAPAIAPTYAQIHPRRVWVEAHWLYFAASALALLTLLSALAVWLWRRRWRSGGQARPAV